MSKRTNFWFIKKVATSGNPFYLKCHLGTLKICSYGLQKKGSTVLVSRKTPIAVVVLNGGEMNHPLLFLVHQLQCHN